MSRRLLFVDDEDVIRITLAAILSRHGFQVATAATVAEALRRITTETFDILLSDLNIDNPGDGLTVVSAMRSTQPRAVTIILTGYPAFETALEAIRQQVDDYIVKPADIPALVESIERKMATPPRERQLPPAKRVAMVLQEHVDRILDLWRHSVQQEERLAKSPIAQDLRLPYIRRILNEVIRSAQSYTAEATTGQRPSATRHFSSQDFAGYNPAMIFAEFSLLRRTLARVVHENLLSVNLSYVIPDFLRVNDSLDEQAQAALAAFSESTESHAV